ncbi:uncharacterized protein BXZ73DRAFT_93357 [Epithele typhae]|uniref:uncharacterized protein n=1 Tax=Epithele typhae TaxID=378194 RepID=UPI00200893C1|nr:uncharacterized protein BXZ73DRAFT_93357 [Epithele typhae]KAH9911538.1 hypothetical protein BXZ73DRAFT_93357 [Epithele typhae]
MFGDYNEYDWEDYDEHQPGEDPFGAGDENIEPELSDDADDDTDDEDAANFDAEGLWERMPSSAASDSSSSTDGNGEAGDKTPDSEDLDAHIRRREERWKKQRVQDALRATTHVVHFPDALAGSPVHLQPEQTTYQETRSAVQAGENLNNLYAPFLSFIDCAVAMWAKMRGPGSTAVTDLLEIEGLASRLGLSFKNSRELNKIIDTKLSSPRPRFKRQEILIAGEVFEVFFRDVIECIRALYGDPEFTGLLVFKPEKHYADPDHNIRVYFDMHTGKWWWETQKALDRIKPGGTIIPIIISSDKTQLTVFGNKTAYPVYLTIGNLPKDIRRKPSRRGQILLAYLPTTKLEHVSVKAARSRIQANLYHACLGQILKPLRKAGIHGINMASGDGILRRNHPILAIHVGDYPEQLLTTCCKSGECPQCDIDRDEVGATTDPDRPRRDIDLVMDALSVATSGTSREFVNACADARIKPVAFPYWQHLPFVNIFRSVTPDILHQLHQGVVKHVISWLKAAYGAEEIDARCRRMPPNHQIRVFMNGITRLQRVTGKEHAAICRFLLGLIVDLPLRDGFSPVRLVRAVRSILDFLYLAQYPSHTSDSLDLLKAALRSFHDDKDIFIALGIRIHFKIPKLHSLDHYPSSITLFGTTDNYDTQYTERLHIELTKDAFRATNRKDVFSQMTLWLERREKMQRHAAFVAWRLDVEAPGSDDSSLRSSSPLPRPTPVTQSSARIHLPKWPSVRRVSLRTCHDVYGTPFLRDALARFIVSFRDSTLTSAQIERHAVGLFLPFNAVPAFHKIKFHLPSTQQMGIMDEMQDVAHARPQRTDRRGRVVPARFDTVLVKEDDSDNKQGIHKYRIGRVRLVFTIPKAAHAFLFPRLVPPQHLAYVEWFTAFTEPDPVHGMYKVSRCRNVNGDRLASVIPVTDIYRSCHLLPVFGAVARRAWTSSTVLDTCELFYFNPFSDLLMYMTCI